jgi:two-component system, cell cycle sensor histidine kinase and response regulator CckA
MPSMMPRNGRSPGTPAGEILLVEPDPTVRAFVVRVLGEEGVQVAEGIGGFQDLTPPPGQVRGMVRVVDVATPGLPDIRLAEVVARMLPDLPVLWTGAHHGDPSLDPGGPPRILLLSKPVSRSALVAVVRDVLEESSAAGASADAE